MRKSILLAILMLVIGSTLPLVHAQDITIQRIATNLQNPRGIAVLPDGRLIVSQAGTGFVSVEEVAARTGSISLFEDVNGDGDFDDADEITPIVSNIASYNALTRFRTGHDEVNGVADLVVLDDGRIYFTKDDPLAEFDRNRDDYRGDTGIFEVSADWEDANVTRIIKRPATINALVYDPVNDLFYMAESGTNRLTIVNRAGEAILEIDLPLLAHNQQPVPAGLAYDPTTGDILVSLFSGFVPDYYDSVLAFMPGDAKVMRYDPDTGELSDAVTGLTTAVDVAVDAAGNIFTVELTTTWSAELMPEMFDLFNPDAPPDAGGYVRYSGRVTLFPADGSAPTILADGLDLPTNVTYHEGRLYVSTGQGTPNRPIWGSAGLTRITGEIYVISGF